MQQWVLGLAVVGISRLMVARDRLLGRLDGGLRGGERCTIPSGANLLDAALRLPAGEPGAAVLLCHGIGETVHHWPRALAILAEHGVASLIFNYSGMGRGSGRFSASQCESDAMAAFAWLHEKLPQTPIALLGFSLGTGVATAVAPQLEIERLVLCEGYTSFRAAACRMGLPQPLRTIFPDVWRNVDALPSCRVPVLIVHGERDRLFPVAMGNALAAACGGTLQIVPGMGHADLHQSPRPAHWLPIIEWILSEEQKPQP